MTFIMAIPKGRDLEAHVRIVTPASGKGLVVELADFIPSLEIEAGQYPFQLPVSLDTAEALMKLGCALWDNLKKMEELRNGCEKRVPAQAQPA
jgi:hypothetical protein